MASADASILPDAVARALGRVEGRPVELLHLGSIAEDRAATELKHIGYGEPALVRYRAGGAEKRCVLHTMAPNWFGHDRRSDRAALVLLAADTYGEVPRHTRVLDVGAFDAQGELVSLAGEGEFYLLTEYAEGALYARDLRAIETAGRSPRATSTAPARSPPTSPTLHRDRLPGPPELYHRALRDLVGSGEGIFGIADSYPEGGPVAVERLAAIERRCRRLPLEAPRPRPPPARAPTATSTPTTSSSARATDFTLLDASRGGAGDPADDVAALTHQLRVRRRGLPRRAGRAGSPRCGTRSGRRTSTPRGDREVLEVLPALPRLAGARGGEPGLVPVPDARGARRAARPSPRRRSTPAGSIRRRRRSRDPT